MAAPNSDRRIEIPRPIPDAAPLITATLPSRDKSWPARWAMFVIMPRLPTRAMMPQADWRFCKEGFVVASFGISRADRATRAQQPNENRFRLVRFGRRIVGAG